MMDGQSLLENLGTIADAPGGVDRLRDLVRSLAVRGRLVPQDQNGDTAPELLQRIDEHRNELTSTGAIPKRRALEPSEASESLWKLPKGWQWASLDDLAAYIQRGKGPAYVETSNLAVVSQKCVQWSGFDISKVRFADEDSIASYGEERFLRAGDLLWNSTGTGTVGRVTVFPPDCELNSVVADSHVTVIRLLECDPMYLLCWLSSREVQDTIDDQTTGTTKQKELNLETVRRYPVPLPPLEEQKRIVAKVDELMSLCDELEKADKHKSDASKSARVSALGSLGRTANQGELSAAWNRIASNWNSLFTASDCVVEIQNMALDLALRGLLSRQDPNDESASALAKRIIEGRSQQLKPIRSGTSARMGSSSDGAGVPLPDGWEYVQLGEVVEIVRGITFPGSVKSREPGPGRVACLRTSNVQLEIDWSDLLYVPEEYVTKAEQMIRTDDIVMSMANSRALVGKVALNRMAPVPAAFGGFVAAIRPIEILSEYLLAVLRLPRTKERLIDSSTQTTNIANISLGRLRPLQIPLAPLAEQARIVAELERVAARCRDLEQALKASEESSRMLARGMIGLLPSSLR